MFNKFQISKITAVPIKGRNCLVILEIWNLFFCAYPPARLMRLCHNVIPPPFLAYARKLWGSGWSCPLIIGTVYKPIRVFIYVIIFM